MKTYPLNYVQDTLIGTIGTPNRDRFEEELQMDFIYKEATATSKAKQSDVDALAAEVKQGWWAKNKSRLVK